MSTPLPFATRSMTSIKRRRSPKAFLRKDARTKVLSMVYGKMVNQKHQRRIAPVWDNVQHVQFVKKQVEDLLPVCDWPSWQVDSIRRHLTAQEARLASAGSKRPPVAE